MKPLESNIQVDLNRYMGKWWVIANIPYFAEKGKVATADEYKLLADGKIDNIYHYRKSFNKSEKSIQATAEVVPNTGNAKWEIGFLWGIIKADYLILEVAPDYSWALIGHPKRNLAWIFSREKVMDENLYVTLREKFRNFGYNPDLILRIPQFKEQIDKPGFQ
ncbi:MAG: lipocalin family protein [Pseudomonadota bacterium]